MMKRIGAVALGYVGALTLWCACGEKKSGAAEETVDTRVQIRVEEVHIQEVEQLAEFTANVTANVTNKIAPQAPVRIEKLLVEVGDAVSAGQLLAETDATALMQAKVQLDNLEQEFRRIDELYKVGGVSRSVWDAQHTSLEMGRTAYRNLLANNLLLSPIQGIVTARNYDEGDMYSGALPVYVVEQISPVKMMVNVSESFFTQVRKGMSASIRLDIFPEEVFEGKVGLIYPTIDEATRTFPVEIKLANSGGRVRPGMFARVTLSFGTQPRVVVPDRAIVKQPGSGERFVYILRNGKVVYTLVTLGKRTASSYEVLSGVSDGDRVAVTALNRLNDGMAVEVVK
ncbi:MAG: efflux RND transporter periplasmic adaptor subunit [Tannerellaceae bacterium]|jgi:RND family efflux transporter MFP subunit|nr:efflux RND transporter periplasmic adaptor subunit [Tannerellaceae bacterium]